MEVPTEYDALFDTNPWWYITFNHMWKLHNVGQCNMVEVANEEEQQKCNHLPCVFKNG